MYSPVNMMKISTVRKWNNNDVSSDLKCPYTGRKQNVWRIESQRLTVESIGAVKVTYC